MKLSRVEQETIISFNEEEQTADVYTHNRKMKHRLRDIAEAFPEECEQVQKNDYGGETYRISKSLVQIRKPYTSERRKKLKQQALESGRRPPDRPKRSHRS